MTVKKLLKGEILIFFLCIVLCIMLILGGGYPQAVLGGISLWVSAIIPSMFPYFFLSALLSGLNVTGKLSFRLSPLTKRLFNTNGTTGYALIMSVLSGYPMGAKIVADLKNGGMLSDAESERASVFCSTSSPLFLTASVGVTMFNSTAFGLLLSTVHLLSAVVVGVIFSFYKRKQSAGHMKFFSQAQSQSLFYDSVTSSVNSTLLVGGIITLFYVFIEILLSNGVLNLPLALLYNVFGEQSLSSGLVLGLIEATRGYVALSKGGITFFTLPVACAISGFGGLSVIAQSVAFLKSAKIKTACFYLGKILHAVICFLLGLIFSLFIV